MRIYLILATLLLTVTVGCSSNETGSNPSAYSQGRPAETSVGPAKNLLEAVQQQNLLAVKAFLDRGESVNQTDESGATPLQISLKLRSSEISLWLSTRTDLDLTKRDTQGRTAFFTAAQMGEVEVLKNLFRLVRSRARWTSELVDPPTIKERQRALHVAATDRTVQVLSDGQDAVDFKVTDTDLFGRNAIHTAALGGRESVLHWMNQEYCDLGKLKTAYEKARSWSPFNVFQNPMNQRDNEGQTPLILAVKSSSLSAARELMNCPYVSLSVQDKNGMTVVHWAAKQSSLILLDFIMSKLGQMDREIAQKNLASRMIASSPGAWNTKDKEGNTPLHYAAMHSDYQFYDRVIREFGTNPDQPNNAGVTPKSIFTCRLNKTTGIRNEALDKMCAAIH